MFTDVPGVPKVQTMKTMKVNEDCASTKGADAHPDVSVQPKTVSGLELAFGGNMNDLLPKWEDIPKEFKTHYNPWAAFISHWFFAGLQGFSATPKQGINADAALRHVKAIMVSFEPKHEHKEAGCAYLMSLWFERVQWIDNGDPKHVDHAQASTTKVASATLDDSADLIKTSTP